MRAVCIARGADDEDEFKSQTYRPKVEVKARSSLYIISYSEVPPFTRSRSRSRVKLTDGGDPDDPRYVVSKCNDFEVSVYIDIPTIDYYKDELQDAKLSKFNKKFKLHLLRDAVFDSFTNGNDLFWDQLMQNSDDQGRRKNCTISISSSGSLRYVETIKFLLETCYDKLSEYIDLNRIALKFELEVTPTSRKWFSTFLNKQIIDRDMIRFVELGSHSKISDSTTTPFKEYYAKLNSKFASHGHDSKDTGKLDSIVIVTNSTGVKALLTILSDRPLTSYIVKESIDALHDQGLRKKDIVDSSEDDTPLKRESSSLLSFQNSLLTSNKDKSVRIRSLSLNQRSNRAHAFSNDEVPSFRTSPNEKSPSPVASMLVSRSSSRYSPTPRSNLATETTHEEDIDTMALNAGINETEDEDEDEDDEDEEDEGDEDGLSFSVPSRLSRAGSSDGLSNAAQSSARPGRFRSLSLMDPAYKGPFSLTATEDQASSVAGSGISNIYIHDGEFEETEVPSRRTKKKINKALISRQNSSNGLIPPEFYSRISSPCTSASSSNSSLHDLSMAPGTFSKWLGPDSSATTSSNSQGDDCHLLFEKNLINKSFEETRNQSSANLFSTLMAGKSDKNPLALNFRSNKTIPTEVQIMDEEDRLMSGYHNGNSNFSAEETSEDERRSVSTVVPDRPSFSNSSRGLDSEGQLASDRRPTETSYKPLNLNLKLYDDEEDEDSKSASRDPVPIKTSDQEDERPKPKYKKAISLDLYGDDDLDSAGGWLLGGNFR